MPWYRINGMTIHMRGTKLPPACVAKVGFSSQHAEATHCLAVSTHLCDWPVDGGRTCDLPLCDAHAREVGKNRHYCPDHYAASINANLQLGLFTSLGQP